MNHNSKVNLECEFKPNVTLTNSATLLFSKKLKMHMRLVRLVLCLIYGLEFIRTFDFASANTVVRNRFPIHSSISTLQTDGANLNFHPDANSDRHSDSESDPGSKIHSELNLDARLAARLRSAYLPNEMMDRKPKRSEFVDTSLETNLDSEGKWIIIEKSKNMNNP